MKKLTFICLLISNILVAQSIGNWKIYSDQKNIQKFLLNSDGIWAATSGGAFNKNSANNEFMLITKANGLNSQDLTSIAVDKANNIWFGSKEGYINIYNPVTKEMDMIMDIFNTGKTQKRINELSVINDTIIAATDLGLSLINTDNFSFYDSFFKFGNFSSETKVFNVLKKDIFYVLTESGVAVQKPGTKNLAVPESWDTYQFGSRIAAQSAKKLIQFGNDILLCGNNGIYKFSNNAWSIYAASGENILDMAVHNGSLYFITANILYVYNGNQQSFVYSNYDVTFRNINVVSGNQIFISTSNGILELKNSEADFIFPDGPATNSFTNMAIDGTGNLWVATGKDVTGVGIMKFDGEVWKTFNTKSNPELQSNAFFNVSASGDNILLSNWGKGLTIYRNEKFETYNASNTDLVGVPSNTNFVSLSAAQMDSRGNIWLANNETMSRRQLSVVTTSNNWHHFNVNSLGSEALGQMVIDQFDTKWFIVLLGQSGLHYFNERNTFTNSADDFTGRIDGLLSNAVSALAVDKRGQLWIGTSQGVNVIFDPSKPSTLSNRVALSVRNQSVSSIAVDPLDNKWVGTNAGVFVLSPDGLGLINHYTTKNSPLPNDDIKSIVINPKDGMAYIGTDNGLAALPTSSIAPVESFDELYVYPNPLIIDGSNKIVTIDGLISNSSIKILDAAGHSIRDFTSPGGRVAFWDGKDDNGNLVSSGVYVIVAYDNEANNVTTAKIAVVRK